MLLLPPGPQEELAKNNIVCSVVGVPKSIDNDILRER